MNGFYKHFHIWVAIAALAVLAACKQDENPNPEASFSTSAVELTITFTNESKNATSYAWDFGDGNTSTEADPTHTFAAEGTYVVSLTARNGDLSDEFAANLMVALDPANVRRQSGYVVVARNEAGDTWYAQYFETMPSGTIDMTQGTAFQSFFPLSIQDGALFMTRTDGSSGFAKIGVNGNNEFVEDGIISTVSGESFSLRTRDADFGVFHDRNDPNKINTFNPTSMQVTGEIDMTAANALVDTAAVRYQTYIFRGDNEIFVPTRLEAGGNVPNVALPKIDISAGTVTSVAEFEGAGSVIVFNRFGQRYIDESGNFYFFHAGNISLPTVSGAVVKIPAGTDDYDPTYNFEVPVVNNPSVNGFGSFLSTFYYYKNDIGYALVNEQLDQQIIDLITMRGGVQNLTPEDIQQITFWLFTSPSGAWVEVNLVNQTVAKINGLPPLSPFDASNMTFVGGTPHFAIANPSVNAFFSLDETTGDAVKLFDVTGANIAGVFDLSINE
ncbi:MAG: PKD domain-containing protein [Bacteroidota bacterium]